MKKSNETEAYLIKSQDWRFNLARLMLTGVVNNQFHSKAEEMMKEATPLMLNAAILDPTYLLSAACFSRNLNMKGLVKVAIACLNGKASDEFLQSNRGEIVELLSTFPPNHLVQFVELCKSKKFGRGFGSRAQKWVGEVIQNWKPWKLEVNTVKSFNQMNQLIRLAHPNLQGPNADLVKYVLPGGVPVGEKQKAVEHLKGLTDPLEAARLVISEGIPWDVVKGIGIKMTKELALAEMTQMGLTALLLNLVSLEKNGVFESNSGLEALALKMEEVKDGRSIPIDFIKPYMKVQSQKVKDILLHAIVDTMSFSMPAIESKSIDLSIDISGSMDGAPLHTSGLLAIPFLKSKNLSFSTFDHGLYRDGPFCPKLKGLSIAKQVENLLKMTAHGSTDVSLSVNDLIASKRIVDLAVVITDEQQNSGKPIRNVWKRYKDIAPNAELWIINATGSPWSSCNFEDPSVTVYQSLTPAIFKNLPYVGVNLVEMIQEYKNPQAPLPDEEEEED